MPQNWPLPVLCADWRRAKVSDCKIPRARVRLRAAGEGARGLVARTCWAMAVWGVRLRGVQAWSRVCRMDERAPPHGGHLALGQRKSTCFKLVSVENVAHGQIPLQNENRQLPGFSGDWVKRSEKWTF
ncbi:hypothetical protein JCM16814_25670 [Desulfobaculum senezii]